MEPIVAFQTGFWLMAGALGFVVCAIAGGFAALAFAGYLMKRRAKGRG